MHEAADHEIKIRVKASQYLALRHIAEAQGMASVAEKAGMPRESLYRALSPRGNPTIKTLLAVLAASGLKLGVTRAERHA